MIKKNNFFINVKILIIFYSLLTIINLIMVINHPTYFGWFTVGLIGGIMFTIPYQSIINSQTKLIDSIITGWTKTIMDWKNTIQKKHKRKKK